MPLKGKNAIVTGAGQGIGRSVVHELALAGSRVLLVGRTESKLVDVAAEVKEITGSSDAAFVCSVDLGLADAVESIVGTAAEVFDGVDIVINNANEAPLGPIMNLDDGALDKAFGTGVFAALKLMQAMQPSMVSRGGGVIINMVTSSAVRWDASGFGAYAASKEALRSLSRTAASEWGQHGIRVNCIAPHALSPGMAWWTDHFPDDAQEFIDTIPMGRIAECDEIGRVVAWLCGPDAAYITGATIPIDGGSARWG